MGYFRKAPCTHLSVTRVIYETLSSSAGDIQRYKRDQHLAQHHNILVALDT